MLLTINTPAGTVRVRVSPHRYASFQGVSGYMISPRQAAKLRDKLKWHGQHLLNDNGDRLVEMVPTRDGDVYLLTVPEEAVVPSGHISGSHHSPTINLNN